MNIHCLVIICTFYYRHTTTGIYPCQTKFSCPPIHPFTFLFDDVNAAVYLDWNTIYQDVPYPSNPSFWWDVKKCEFYTKNILRILKAHVQSDYKSIELDEKIAIKTLV